MKQTEVKINEEPY